MRSCLARRSGEVGAVLAAVSLAFLAPGTAAGQTEGAGQEPKELQGIVVPEPKPIDYGVLAGLPPGTAAEVLTLERTYTLALVKARAPKGPLAERLDPKTLREQAARLGVADFARFRDEFLRPPGPPDGPPEGHFRDPSASVFGVLRQLMAVETAGKDIQALGDLVATVKELAAGEGGEMLQLALDSLNAELEKARREYSTARLRYGDRLDALKVELGLSPHAPVVADAERLAPFRKVFAEVERWQRDPRRNLDRLPRLVNRLAPMEGGVLDFVAGRPRLAAVAADPARLEPVLLAAESLAVKNRGGKDPDGTIALQVRRRIRHLVETHSAYEAAKRELVALLRLKDSEFEKLIAPPVAEKVGPAVPINRRDLIAVNAEVNGCESRLVSLWATFHTERLALAREVRLMPASDWASFYASFAVPLTGPAPPASKTP